MGRHRRGEVSAPTLPRPPAVPQRRVPPAARTRIPRTGLRCCSSGLRTTTPAAVRAAAAVPHGRGAAVRAAGDRGGPAHRLRDPDSADAPGQRLPGLLHLHHALLLPASRNSGSHIFHLGQRREEQPEGPAAQQLVTGHRPHLNHPGYRLEIRLVQQL
ncbi:hypothetical protein CRUP_037367, partial [Coryphaenoides rupestris]